MGLLMLRIGSFMLTCFAIDVLPNPHSILLVRSYFGQSLARNLLVRYLRSSFRLIDWFCQDLRVKAFRGVVHLGIHRHWHVFFVLTSWLVRWYLECCTCIVLGFRCLYGSFSLLFLGFQGFLLLLFAASSDLIDRGIEPFVNQYSHDECSYACSNYPCFKPAGQRNIWRRSWDQARESGCNDHRSVPCLSNRA